MGILEDKAKQVHAKLDETDRLSLAIREIAAIILFSRVVDGEVMELTQLQKQKLISKYATLKADLQAKVSELP